MSVLSTKRMLSASSRRFPRYYRATHLLNHTSGPDPASPIRIHNPFTTIPNSPSPKLLQSQPNENPPLNPKSIDLHQLTQLFKLAIASKAQPLNSKCFLTVAKAFAEAENSDQLLLNLTDQVLNLTSPSLTVINRLLHALGQCKETQKAILVFSHIKGLNFEPDLYTYNIVLEILGRAGRTDEMLGMFGDMKEAGIGPDLVSYNTVINHVRKFGEVEMCLVYFNEMVEVGVKPDLLSYSAVIDGLGRSGKIEESLKLFGEMKERQIRPSLYLYRAVISNLKKMRRVELAVSFMEEMNSVASNQNQCK